MSALAGRWRRSWAPLFRVVQALRHPQARRRWSLWLLLFSLVLALLVTVVWLAGRYEASQVQDKLERDTSAALADIRAGLTRNLQAVQALQASAPTPGSWRIEAASVLREHPEILRMEWRDRRLAPLSQVDTPFRANLSVRTGLGASLAEVALACTHAQRSNAPSYSPTYFFPLEDGTGLELMELCMPVQQAGQLGGFVVITYSLQDILQVMVERQLSRNQEISFTEPDGTRLAVRTSGLRGLRMFTARQLLDLPGHTLVLRVDSWRSAPDLFPNVLTALVTGMAIALVSVLVLLAKDHRRRLSAERELAEALAFRKAMEDSLVTGLRARDLQGRISYVNPAFCQMVGYSADELLGHGSPAPYWPPDLVDEYRQRQAVRLAGNLPPREGFESEFMHKSGHRFPVLIFEAPLINAQGEQTGWMSAFLDISEQRRIEELSRASQDRLQATARLATVGEMASLLSHELNQPLAAISSYATGSLNLLREGEVDVQEVMLPLQRIAEQAERAGRVIKSVHDFVRRRDKEREMVAPQALLDAIMPLVSLQARKLQVRVDCVVQPALPPVWCDRTMVEQVLLNLARNAMQAMAQSSVAQRVLTLRVRPGARWGQADPDRPGKAWVEFVVADQGPGIADDVAAKLFTPFFTTKVEGMGLGLSLCRTVVEQHGGFLGFEANTPHGTIFRFTLPAQAPRASVAEGAISEP